MNLVPSIASPDGSEGQIYVSSTNLDSSHFSRGLGLDLDLRVSDLT